MKKFYYFSKSKLKFVEIRNFYKKFVFLVFFFAILVSFFVFGTFLVFNEFINPDSEVKALKRNNQLYKEKLETVLEKFQNFSSSLEDLHDKSKDLRLKSNLEVKNNETDIGLGGNLFEPIETYSSNEINEFLKKTDNFVNKISLKIKLEKENYNEIENTFRLNDKLYDVIPAIRPCEGTIADDFGMRFHPILKIFRMHNGVDILTDTGTKVYAPGAGIVDFIGWRGGYGLTLEIDHGFGYRTMYCHLESTMVKVGQKLIRGNLIALSGNSGRLSTGPHLHYEVHNYGVALDPLNFIFDDVKIFEVVKK
jgi:murein DD-endopeptidase MepM/ murein hydrolase activator NlpD